MALADLDYADDICLISDRVEKAQELLNRVEEECARVGLRLNSKKTEVITYNILSSHCNPDRPGLCKAGSETNVPGLNIVKV